MNPEVLKIKKNLDRETPQEKKWIKLLEKGTAHPREAVIDRWATHQESFDQDEKDSMQKHLGICPDCELKLKNSKPLLQQAS